MKNIIQEFIEHFFKLNLKKIRQLVPSLKNDHHKKISLLSISPKPQMRSHKGDLDNWISESRNQIDPKYEVQKL